jgi:hypothetical protein
MRCRAGRGGPLVPGTAVSLRVITPSAHGDGRIRAGAAQWSCGSPNNRMPKSRSNRWERGASEDPCGRGARRRASRRSPLRSVSSTASGRSRSVLRRTAASSPGRWFCSADVDHTGTPARWASAVGHRRGVERGLPARVSALDRASADQARVEAEAPPLPSRLGSILAAPRHRRSDLRGGDERDPIALVRPGAVGDRRLGPDPTARASSTSPVRRHSTSATLRTAVAACPGSPRFRGERHSPTGLGAMGAATVATPVASASVVPTASQPTMPTVSRRSHGAGPGSGGPRPAGSWVVESDRRLGPNGAPQPPAPRLVSDQPTRSATLGRPAARHAGGGAHVLGGRQRVHQGRDPERRGRCTGAWRSAPPL